VSIKDQVKNFNLEGAKLCHFAKISKQLNLEDQKSLAELFDKKVAYNIIAKILKAEGHTISGDAIRVHTVKDCRCESA
jgi:hypothetical protein